MAHEQHSSSPPPESPDVERCFYALLLLRRGFTIPEIAGVLPNAALNGQPGVSVKSAEIIIRQGARSVLTCVLLGRPSHLLPLDLWPPQEVREGILELRSAGFRVMLARLREWLTSAQP